MNFFCSKDCPDTCGMEIVKDEKGISFKAVKAEWQTSAFLCSKMKVYAEREIDNGITSWVKDGDEKRHLTDEEAIELVSETFKEYQGKRVLYMKGSGSLGYSMNYWNVLASKLGFTTIEGNPCVASAEEGHEKDFGDCINPPIENLKEADTVILFGSNPANTSQHLFAYLKELKKSGKKIIYTDIVKMKTASIADRFIHIKPACEGLLAKALLIDKGYENGDIHELIKRCGISEEDFRFLSDSIIPSKTAMIQGHGLQRQSNGMNAIQWLNRLAVRMDCTDLLYFGSGSKRFWQSPKAPFDKSVNIADAVKKLADGEFDLFVCIACNPVVTHPESDLWEKAIEKTKTIIVDTNEERTSKHADLFLKVGGMFAQKEVMASYFFDHKQSRDRFTNEMSDSDAVSLISEKLGLGIEIDLDNIPEKDVVYKRDYVTKELELTQPIESDKLQLLTSSHSSYLNSQIVSGMEKSLQVIHINPADAKRLNIKDGDNVRVHNETGEFEADALVTDDIVEGSLMCWKNIPMKRGYVNSVVPSIATDAGCGLNYYSVFVDIEALS